MDQDTTYFRIADLDSGDKPREKALAAGIGSLSNAELIAIIFGSGMPGKSVIALAQEILRDNDFRLSRMARMSIHEMASKYQGVGPAKAVSLAAAFELGTRCVQDFHVADASITGGDSVYALMRQTLERSEYEQFWVLHLNRANRLICKECISRGGIASTVVDVKLLMKRAVDKLSTSLILVHNHPSGNMRPSAEDDRLTERIRQAAAILDVRVLDHVIIGPGGYYSYHDEGRI